MTRYATSYDGIRIAYEDHGAGEPALVFVHGWSCDRSYWEEQLDAFAREFRIVTVDLAGHGESSSGRDAWTIAAFGEDVIAVFEELGLERAILIGHSMGGDVIVDAAPRLAHRVAGLIWIDRYREAGSPRTPEERAAFTAKFRADFVGSTRSFARRMFHADADPALVERVATDMSASPLAVALPTLAAAIGYETEIWQRVQRLGRRVIAINPDSPPSDASSMRRYGVEVVFMSRVGHFPMMEDPGRFNAVLRRAIESLAQSPPSEAEN